MALGGWLPAARCSVSFVPDGFSRAAEERNSNLAPKTLLVVELTSNEADWVIQGYESRADSLRRVNSMDKPNGRLVLVSYMHYCTSTSNLSTGWSSRALQGDLILERASRLYAFSGYHNRTSLPSRAIGMTTGTQEVRPSRSSRTKDSPPQISYAHSR